MKKKNKNVVFLSALAFAIVFMAVLITMARNGRQPEMASADVEPQYENVLEEFQMGR